MPQPTETWDTATLGCPEERSYAVTQATLHLSSRPIEGASRFRRVQEEGLLSLSVRVQQSQEQYDAFRLFYFNTLNAGTDWFFMPLLLGLEEVTLVCHIQNGFKQERNQTVHDTYLTSFTLEAFRKVSVAYSPTENDIIDATGPENPSLGTLDIIDATGPENPSLGTLDVIYGGPQVGFS